MWFYLFCFLIIRSDILNNKKHPFPSGNDERPFKENKIPISIIKENFDKKKLLEHLQSNDTSELTKLQLIYNSDFLSYLNPNHITAMNLTRGLEW
jgi:hypothetical protein